MLSLGRDLKGEILVNDSGRDNGQRVRPLEWVLLVLVTLGVVLVGYHHVTGRWAITTREGQAPSLSSQPSGLAEETGQTLTNAESTNVAPSNNPSGREAGPHEMAGEERSARAPNASAAVVQEKPEVKVLARSVATVKTAPPLRPPVGQLLVTSNVTGAKIAMDGQSKPNWITPYKLTNLPPGSHSVVVSSQGYREAQQSVVLEAGQAVSVNVILSTPNGEIDISTNPPAAEVLIDGKSYGPSPVNAKVNVGQHTFLVKQAGRESVAGNVTVQDQDVVTRSIELPPVAPVPPGTNVEVTTNPPSAAVYADGAPMGGKTPTSFHLSPGHHTLIIVAAGYGPVRREVDVPETGAVTVNATLSRQ
jgi:hypothetical protein